MTYAEVKDGVWNLWNQPIDGGAPKPVTNFTSDQIFSFGWSTDDGKRLAIARGDRHQRRRALSRTFPATR